MEKSSLTLADRRDLLYKHTQAGLTAYAKRQAGVYAGARVVTIQRARGSLNKGDTETTKPDEPWPQRSAAVSLDLTPNPADYPNGPLHHSPCIMMQI